MTLGRVGSDAGPDIERLTRLRRLAPAHRIFAAGGVRDQSDLDQLAGLGIAGALVSTALHRGTLPLGPPVA
jgi:phosphoribosylformimino-5-aminoimidazole carboxamide ribotide isomerase